MRLILGSGSPRRRELLEVLGLVPDGIRAPEIDESVRDGEVPAQYVRRIVRAKADALSAADDEVILCADTTVAVGRRIFGKPADEAEARSFLSRLSGRRHTVITGIAAKTNTSLWTREVSSAVKFKRLSELEIQGYLRTGDWQGKAGGYAIQGPAAAFVTWISGSHSGIVGLPLAETAAVLQAAGLEIWR